MNAGLLNSGSIEVIPELPNPKNPAEKIRGPICTGIAALGEEQPALKEIGQPQAVFADGTPVPPDYRVNDWLDVFAEVAKESDVADDPTESYAALVNKFSEYSEAASPGVMDDPANDPQRQQAIEVLRQLGYPVDDPEMLVMPTLELLKMADEEKQKAFAAKFAAHFAANFAAPKPGSDAFKAMKAKEDPNYPWYDDKDYSAAFSECGMPETEKKNPAFAAFAKGFSAAFSKQFAMGPDATMPAPAPPVTSAPAAPGAVMSAEEMSQKFTAMSAELEGMKKKMGALEAAESDKQVKSAEMSAKAFSDQAQAVFQEPDCKGKVKPPLRAKFVSLYAPTTQEFSAGTAKPGDKINEMRADLKAMAFSEAYVETIDDQGTGGSKGALTPLQIEVLGSETFNKHIGPKTINAILGSTAAK
jgi:hypothetical protein